MTRYVNLNKLPADRRPDWTPREALAKARQYDAGRASCDHGHSFKGYCAHLAFCVYGMVSSGYYDAHSMWRNTPAAFKRYDRNPPAGAIACYVGGSHGHVAIVDTFGNIFTNDIAGGRYSAGAYNRAPLLSPETAFGHRYVGWIFPYAISAEDGRTPPKTKKPKPKTKPKVVTHDHVPGRWVVDTAVLNGRRRPSTSAKIKFRRRRGAKLKMVKAFRNEGRLWFKTDKGTYYAADYLKRKGGKH